MATGGGRSTRSSSNIDSGIIKTLAFLKDDDISKLKDDFAVTNHKDLVLLDKDDIDQTWGIYASSFI